MSSAVHIETLDHPLLYTADQLERARQIAVQLSRGRLVLCEAPGR